MLDNAIGRHENGSSRRTRHISARSILANRAIDNPVGSLSSYLSNQPPIRGYRAAHERDSQLESAQFNAMPSSRDWGAGDECRLIDIDSPLHTQLI